LVPDAVVVGKPLGGGMPCAAYGFSTELAERAVQAKRLAPPGHSGIGTTLTANLLAMAAMRATLSTLMTDATFAPMHAMAGRLAEGLRSVLARHNVPWCVTQVGARVEFQFCPVAPVNGTEAGLAMDSELEHAIHLYLLNREVMITPFHNMMLICPDTRDADVQRLLQGVNDFLSECL
jgi:glutamate-1-semialdehyde 2,1-aminomutase